MKVVIFGAGRRGLRLARHLIKEKKEVTFLDSSQQRCLSAQAKLDCMAVCGSATDIEKLIEAGCASADAVIAVTDSDETNLVSCGIVSSQWPEVETIAAIRAISYLGTNSYDRKILGITHIVNPEQEAASRIAGVIQSGLFSDIIYFKGTEFILFTKTMGADSPFNGKNLIQMKKEFPGRYVVAGIRRGGKVFTPTGATVIEENDEIVIVADDDESTGLFTALGGFVTTKLKRTVMVGGTRIASYLLKILPDKVRKSITLIEEDTQTCNEFIEDFPSLLVLNGSITDEQLWEEEAIERADLLISVTEDDELNIITASYAKKIGVKRSIALIKTNPNYLGFARHMDIDAPISTTDATVDTLMKHLRGEGVSTLHSIFNGDLEVYEYVLTENFKELGKQLKEVKLKGKCIIAGVKRTKEDNFIPDGNYTFTEGDTLLVAATHDDNDFVTEFFGA